MTVRRGMRRGVAAVLLLLPLLALLAVPGYDRTTPVLGGVPFFFWYQLAWVPLTALLLAGAASLLRTPPGGPTPGGPPHPGGRR